MKKNIKREKAKNQKLMNKAIEAYMTETNPENRDSLRVIIENCVANGVRLETELMNKKEKKHYLGFVGTTKTGA